MPFVSITRLRVRHWRLLPQFLIPSIRIARQAQRQPETSPFQSFATLIGLSGPGTVWRDEAAMRAFMQSGLHRRVMARVPEWCDEAALVRWGQDTEEPPSWTEAHRRLKQERRRSRVSHPSEASAGSRSPSRGRAEG
jgi:hypothetical protein